MNVNGGEYLMYGTIFRLFIAPVTLHSYIYLRFIYLYIIVSNHQSLYLVLFVIKRNKTSIA